MTKRYRIKDIAEQAGVSAGTVDRVIHSRGDVSPEARRKVEEVLAKIDYQPNMYASVIGTKKKYTLGVVLPQFHKGEYWELIENGIRKALFEFSNIRLKVNFLYYDQFDLFSARTVFATAAIMEADAMLIGPTFRDEAIHFVNSLSNRGIPYVFVDTMIEGTKPLAFFGLDSHASGYVEAKLLLSIVQKGTDIAVFQAKRVGDEIGAQIVTRKYGFMAYLSEQSPETRVVYGQYSNADKKESWRLMDQFFSEHTNIGGAVIFNSRVYLVSDYFKKNQIRNIRLVGCGAIEKNITALKEGYLDYLIAERPELQGYSAVKAILKYLLYKTEGPLYNYTPIDVLIKESVDFYTGI